MGVRAGSISIAVIVLGLLLGVSCIRVEIQRTRTPELTQPIPTVVQRDIEVAESTPAARAERRGQASGGVLRTLFRYRMPPATALEIARLGIAVTVVDVASIVDERGWYWPVPQDAAAHLVGTANPGEPGNIAITGHVDTERGPGVFWRLGEIRPGDEIRVWSAAGTFVYQVVDVQTVAQSERAVLRQTDREILTLLTCVPDGRYERRLVVRAEPVRPAVATR